jgi:opacity protein-like surface antigen
VRLIGWLRNSIVAGAAMAVSCAAALAADMPGSFPLPLPVQPAPLQRNELFPGWYVRADLGGHWGVLQGAQSAAPFPNPTNSKLNQGVTATLGFGVKSDWLRTDVTIDYASPLKYQGSFATPGDTTAKIQATTALFNAYIDLGTWYRITPYIGAGAGAAYTRVTDYMSGGAPPFAVNTDKNQWGFAWAAMAGVAFPVSHNMIVDVGYRYLNIGNVKTDSDAFGAMTFKNVAAHEVRVGLRWSFDDFH